MACIDSVLAGYDTEDVFAYSHSFDVRFRNVLRHFGIARPGRYCVDPPQGDVAMIIVERTADAFGGGSPYTLSIYADGRVTYKPRGGTSMYDAMSGKTPGPSPTPAAWNITSDQMQQIFAAFTQADFFSLRDRYQDQGDGCPTTVTDAPSANVTLNLRDKSKTVQHYMGCREVNSGPVFPRAAKRTRG